MLLVHLVSHSIYLLSITILVVVLIHLRVHLAVALINEENMVSHKESKRVIDCLDFFVNYKNLSLFLSFVFVF